MPPTSAASIPSTLDNDTDIETLYVNLGARFDLSPQVLRGLGEKAVEAKGRAYCTYFKPSFSFFFGLWFFTFGLVRCT